MCVTIESYDLDMCIHTSKTNEIERGTTLIRITHEFRKKQLKKT